MIKPNLTNLESDDPKKKYSCAKKCIVFSKNKPEQIYPDLEIFVKLLKGDNQILKWTALQVIGNLSQIDTDRKVDTIVPYMIDLLDCGKLITASNSALGLAEIARNKSYLKDKILSELIKVEHYSYNTPECTNVVIGNIVKILSIFKEDVKKKTDILEFLKRQTQNSRPGVRNLAYELLK